MKKLVMLMMVMLLLGACGTESSKPNDNVQGSAKEKSIVLYKSDANAEYTMPFEEKHPSKNEDLVKFIFAKVNEHDVELLDYKFDEKNNSLLLNLGDDVYTIQGSAGATMFVETLVKSYFENYPKLQEVTFIYKGSYEPILDHMMIGEPYKRADFKME